MSHFPIITTNAQLVALARELRGESILAIDLEADSMHHYHEQVCLLQLSYQEHTILIDPLQGLDLSPLGEIFSDPAVRKIFHAADYDLRCLRRDFGLQIHGLFDTMISAQLLGEEKIGLADLLQKYFGISLDKRFQRADWSIRPLPSSMIEYAAEDTRHLQRLMTLFEKKLVEKGRYAWAAEEFSLLEEVRFNDSPSPLYLRVKGAAALSRRQLGVLEALLRWREHEAERRDRPPFHIIGNVVLLAMATLLPKKPSDLSVISGLPARQAERYGRDLLKAVQYGLECADNDLPVWPRTQRQEREPVVDARLAALKAWRRNEAASLALDPGVLINNALLESLARSRPGTMAELDEFPGLKRWQRHTLGDDLLTLLSKLPP